MYQGTDYAATVERFRRFMITEGRNGLSPERLGQTVYTALTARHPKTSYTAIPQRLKNWSLPLFPPKRLVDKMIAKQLGTAENLDGRLICPSVRTHRRPKVYLGQTCVPTFKQLEIRKSSDR
jgi:hypothetical protein